MTWHRNQQYIRFIVPALVLVILLIYFYKPTQDEVPEESKEKELIPPKATEQSLVEDSSTCFYDHELPLIFIGGFPRSGTTLLRTMLDAHEEIRCGPETRIIPDTLLLFGDLRSNGKFGELESIAIEALGEFVLNIIKHNGAKATYLCDKDPFTAQSISLIETMFGNMRYVLLVRDPRATAHSVLSRQIQISGIDNDDYRDIFSKWNNVYTTAWADCQNVEGCILVHYEDVVLRPIQTTKDIFEFFNIFWSDTVLHHEQHLNTTKLAVVEPSNDQVKKALYMDALTSWFGKIPIDILRDVPDIMPIMTELGYNPYDPTPDYGPPDDFVLKKGIWAN